MRLSPHALTLRQLQYAVAVADTRRFRRAAELCHVSQPSLSAQLAELESALGVRLFERDRRRVLLTSAGEEVVARARRILLEADDLTEAARHLGDPLAGTLRIGVIPTVSPYLLPHAAPALATRFPRMTVRWVEDKTPVLVRDLEAGLLDAALLALEAELGDVAHAVVAKDPFVLAAPRGHELVRSARPARLDDLRGAHVLLLEDGHCLREQALTLCTKARADELGFRATSLPTLVQMVSAGAGVTLLPELAMATELRRTQLAYRPFAAPAPHRTIVLIWRRRSPLEPTLTQIAAALRDAYPPPPILRRAPQKRAEVGAPRAAR